MSADALSLYDRARASGNAGLNHALDTLDAAYRLYGASRIAVAFNGGKDATVVLHLARASMAHWARERGSANSSLTCLYLPPGDGHEEFPQLLTFVKETVTMLHLDAHEVPGGFKRAIQRFGEGRDLLAFVMGTRQSDPHAANLEHFSPSSAGWPPFMRVNPILKWHYDDVWTFLRGFDIPYCTLYNAGYTSIGSMTDTAPNPALQDGKRYQPAWELRDATLERAGRRAKTAKKGSEARSPNCVNDDDAVAQ